MTTYKNVLAISGSTRKQSTNEAVLQFIADKYRETLRVEIFTGIAGLPHFNPDLDQHPPRQVVDFRQRIAEADGIIICTPEYVFSLPGALKNAIEWTVSTTVFTEKPAALIVASSLGEKALESLLLIMTTLQAKVPDGGSLLLSGARAKVGNGEITDPEAVEKIEDLIAALMEGMG